MATKKIVLTFFSATLLLVPVLAAEASFNYTPMEPIPGTSTVNNFCDYIQAVYKFGIWTVGIAAMFMIMFGGYTYLLSAGNNASMEKAKGFIFDAIAGLVLALTAYLILYVINPDLIKIKIFCDPSATNQANQPPNNSTPRGVTDPLAEGCDKYDAEFANAAGNDPHKKCLLIAIANQESTCNPNAATRVDNGIPSCGMMQVQPGAGLSCDDLSKSPEKSIQRAAAMLESNKAVLSGSQLGFSMGTNYAAGEDTIKFGSFTYYTGNDDLIASYNAGPGTKASSSTKKGPFAKSEHCPTPPTPAWQCDIEPGGFITTQNYVMSAQAFQAKCLAEQK